jgi:hypothetical protein
MRYVVIGLCALAVACSGQGSAAPTSPSSAIGGTAVTQANGGSALPFKGQLQSTERVVSMPDDNTAVRHLDGTGNATHLGQFTLSADFTVTMSTGNATGTATWTAANGDQIRASVVGHGDIVAFPTVTIAETHTITGGTGRFANASGIITIERSANILTGASTGSLSGTISLGH